MFLSLPSVLLLAWMVSGADKPSSSSSSGGDKSYDKSYKSPDPSVFVLGEYFDYDTFVLLVSIVGGCAIVIEMALSKYERWLKREGDTFQSTLYEKIVRELMTLGVVSFALFLLQPVVAGGDLFLTFEFSHYVIFFIAIFTVLQLIVLGASTYPIKRGWDIAAYKSKDELITGYREMVVHMRKWSLPVFGLGRVSLDVFHWGSNWKWIDAVHYHIARSIFIRQHGTTANFDFARYASLVADRQILNMANISLRSWLALVGLRWIVYGLQKGLSRDDSDTVSFKTWLVFGVVLCLLELSVLFACVLGVKRVCIKLGADPGDPVKTLDAVLDKIWVAPVTHVQHAASMHAVTREPLAALEEHSAFDARGNTAGVVGSSSSAAPAAAPAEVATAHGGAGGGGVGGATKAEADIARSGVQFGSGGIPKITMRDAFIVHGNIYTLAVEILMMLNSYYLAFYAVYFISRASKSSTDGVWIILLPLPILGGVLMAYRRVVPLIALLSTIVMMQPTDVADVEQEAKELNKTRRKLVMRVEDVLEQELKATQVCSRKGEICPEGETSAAFLIKRWDEDNSGTLSYKELEVGLKEIDLVLSSTQRRELFRLADPDRSGSVDVNELADLLYDVQMAAAAETSQGEEEEEQAEVAAAAVAGRQGAVGEGATGGNFTAGDGGGDDRMVAGGRPHSASANDRVERLLWKRASEKRL
ncbi:unnamed protein product [Pylaiella littoralis]